MHRRAFFTTAVTGIVTAAAGCMGIGERATYQRCTKPFVPLHEIPSGIRGEVETALADDEYTALKLRYPTLVSDDTTLWEVDDNRYYTHHVETGLLTEKLTFEEITPSHDDSGDLKVSNQTANTVEINVTISADGAVLVDAEQSVDPAEDILEVAAVSNTEYAGEKSAATALPGVEFPNEFRGYDVEISIETIEDEHTETATVDIHPWFTYYWVQISDDGVLAGPLWENDSGFFSDGPNDSKEGVHWECTQPPSGWPQERDR